MKRRKREKKKVWIVRASGVDGTQHDAVVGNFNQI